MKDEREGMNKERGSNPLARYSSFILRPSSLALLVTVAILPLAWAYAWKWWMLLGRPRPWSIAALLLGILIVARLAAARARGAKGPGFGPLWWATLGGWIAANAGLGVSMAGPLISPAAFVALYVAAGLWILWSAWMFHGPLSATLRLAVLTPLLALLAATVLLLKADGLSGTGGLNYVWRYPARSRPAMALAEPVAPAVAEPMAPAAAEPAVSVSEPAAVDADAYPQFLGPQRRAVLEHAHLSGDWSRRPPRLVWRNAVGPGWGSFAVVGNHVFTQEQREGDECVVCYRLSNGEPLWRHADRQRFNCTAGPGPRATPSVVGDRVYTVGATGLLNCLQADSGRVLWSVNMLADNQAENIDYGVSGSPLIVDDLVLVSPTGRNGISLAAYHKQTGKRAWRAAAAQAGYSSPLLATLAGVPQILLYDSAGVTAHDVAQGRALWSFPWTNSDYPNCTQPIAAAGAADQVFVSTGYGKGGALFRVTHPSAGQWEPQLLWKSRALSSKFSTAVVHKDHLYGLDNGVLVCVSLATGERRWRAGRYHHGQLLLAGNLLLVQAESGEVFLVAPTPAGLRELGHFAALEAKTWNNPALAGRFLLVRNDREAACFELPQEQGKAADGSTVAR
jgi:outer membrane protein assembly factor BamB